MPAAPYLMQRFWWRCQWSLGPGNPGGASPLAKPAAAIATAAITTSTTNSVLRRPRLGLSGPAGSGATSVRASWSSIATPLPEDRVKLLLQPERGHERLLRDLDPADLLHALLALFLAFEQLALPGDVAAVALREHVLALGLDGLAGDDPPADRGLDRHVEQLARDQLTELRGHPPPVRVGLGAVHDGRER